MLRNTIWSTLSSGAVECSEAITLALSQESTAILNLNLWSLDLENTPIYPRAVRHVLSREIGDVNRSSISISLLLGRFDMCKQRRE